jgi:hypothetical protein
LFCLIAKNSQTSFSCDKKPLVSATKTKENQLFFCPRSFCRLGLQFEGVFFPKAFAQSFWKVLNFLVELLSKFVSIKKKTCSGNFSFLKTDFSLLGQNFPHFLVRIYSVFWKKNLTKKLEKIIFEFFFTSYFFMENRQIGSKTGQK